MAKVLCIGLNPAVDVTLALDKLNVGAVNRVQTSHVEPAGKAINVASILAQLGHEVTVTGFLGADNCQIFHDKFAALNLHNEFVYIEGATRQNIKIAESCGQMTDVNGQGFLVNEGLIDQLFSKIYELAKLADMVVLSGSLPQGFALGDFDQLIRLILSVNQKLAVDTSGQALQIAINNAPFLIKPNKDEICEMLGVDSSFDEVAYFRQLFEANPTARIAHTVISLGEHGVKWLQTKQHHSVLLTANAPKVTVKSTVGAGDTLLAGMVHGLLLGATDEAVLMHAVAMAAHAVSITGFELACDARLQDLSKDIQIQQIDF